MANQFISSEDITNLVIGAAGDFSGGLLSSLLLASKIAHRFQPDKQKQALREALEEALTEACKLFPEAHKSVTRYYLGQLSKFLNAQIVIAEIGKLLDPNPATLLEKELLSQEFIRITQGYPPDQMPDLDFDLFVETVVYTFYMAVKGKEPLQEIIKIERLDQLVQQVVKTFALLEKLLANSEGSSRGIAELILIAQRQAQTFEEIKLLLEAQRDGLILFPQFKTPTENFLISYLGTDKEPVPFGGRDEQLAQLEQWRSQSTRQRLLLVAPAGRGKSALLVRWSQKLVNRDDVAVLFMPISARFGTNRDEVTFACLAVRLAHLYGKEIPTDFAHFTPNLWRGLVADYLREPLPDGRQLLVILDGLDEAAWDGFEDIFPLQLPPGIRLVVSARFRAGETVSPRPWLQRLGWDRFTELAETLALPELTLDGVRDVLIKMGCPLDELGAQVDIVSELYRLSEGDPLLVELYVKDLWSKGKSVTRLKPQDLEKIQPGYKGFFDKWWDDQEKLWGKEKPLLQSMTRTLLNLLATARGPLLLDDLLSILARDPLVDGFHIQEAIKPLSRFVLGDGREQGYVFAHPRLGDYFWGGLGHREQVRWEEFFLDWGKTTIKQLKDGLLRYEDVSLYLLQYYASHLRRREAPLNAFLNLLSYQWMQAWHTRTGTYTGFLRDVDQVWGKLAQANKEAVAKENIAPFLGLEIRCALYHASVHSLAENLSDELLIQLLINNIWTEEQVLAYARHKHDLRSRCETLLEIALKLSSENSEHILREIVQISGMVKDEWYRAGILGDVAKYLPQEVLKEASSIEDEWHRALVLSALAPHLPQEVLKTVSAIEDEWAYAFVLCDLVPFLPWQEQAAKWAVVLKIANTLEDALARARVWSSVAPHLSQEEQAASWATALKAASEIEDEWSRVDVLSDLAMHLPREVLKAANTRENGRARAKVLSSVVPYLPQEEQAATWAAELTAAVAMKDGWVRAYVLSALAPHLPQEVLKAVNTLEDERAGAEVLTSVAPYLPQDVLKVAHTLKDEWPRSCILRALASFLPQEVLMLASSLRDEGARAHVLSALASHLPKEVLKAASTLENGRNRAKVLSSVVPYLPQTWAAALKASSSIEDEGVRAHVLSALASHLPKEVLKAASTLEDKEAQAEVLSSVASYLPQDEQAATWVASLVIASAIEDERSRAHALSILASHLPHEVLEAARAIEREGPRAQVLKALAPHLPHEVLEVASAIESENCRALVFSSVALHLPKEQQAATWLAAFAAARAIENHERVLALIALAPHLPHQVLETVSAEEFSGFRDTVLRALAPHLPQEVLKAANTLEYEQPRANVLCALARHLPQEVLKAARRLKAGQARAEVLSSVIPYLHQEVQAVTRSAALTAVSEIKDEGPRVEIFSA